jgi:hypothetical protein
MILFCILVAGHKNMHLLYVRLVLYQPQHFI